MRASIRCSHCVDIVLCIDIAERMQPMIEQVKLCAIQLCEIFREAVLQKSSHTIDKLRAKVIAFRGASTGKGSILGSQFFELPTDILTLRECILSLTTDGGEANSENALDALAYAIRTHWTTEGTFQRHSIFLWSNATTHRERGSSSSTEDRGQLPKDFQELSLWWGDECNPGYMDQRRKRLLMYAPNLPCWERIPNEWDNVAWVSLSSAQALRACDNEEILRAVW